MKCQCCGKEVAHEGKLNRVIYQYPNHPSKNEHFDSDRGSHEFATILLCDSCNYEAMTAMLEKVYEIKKEMMSNV